MSEYPSYETILKAWTETGSELGTRFEQVTGELLTTASMLGTPGEETIQGNIAFLALHECYHVGQLASVRRMLGYTRPFG